MPEVYHTVYAVTDRPPGTVGSVPPVAGRVREARGVRTRPIDALRIDQVGSGMPVTTFTLHASEER